MIIREIELYHVVMKMKEEFRTSFGVMKERHTLIVKVVNDEGIEGWGEVVADEGPWYSYETVTTAWHIIKDFIAPRILGRNIDLEDYKALISGIRGHNMAKAGIEFALWDLKSRLEGKPLYQVIGGVRDVVDVGISIGIKSSIDELLRAISKALDDGYLRIKLKIKPGWDLKVVDRVRREYPDIKLQVDANAAYTLNDLPLFKELDRYDLLMIEQPLHHDDLIDHAELQRRIKTPICLDESIKGLRDVIAAYKLGSCLIVNVKPGRVGGLSETLAINEFTEKVGMPIWIGGMVETGIGRSFAIAAATLSNVRYPNDISPSNRFWYEDLIEPPWIVTKGRIKLPNKKGIGVDVLEDRVIKYSKNRVKLKSH